MEVGNNRSFIHQFDDNKDNETSKSNNDISYGNEGKTPKKSHRTNQNLTISKI